ncbi:MAG: hypothetical protein HC789_14510 [Microcoleus sp. CSU_2_2]|nr:hypothetical protein [Microcoleus sp. SU_5_3]NJS11490.1 hypothetical protein [Microcoleus sp. CSU_2_2]
MNLGTLPDENPSNLPEQLLLQDAKAGNCIVIHCGTDRLLGDAPRLVAVYGGNPQDWDKMTSVEAFEINGASVQVHWFRNSQTLQDVEFKFKRQYPKVAPNKL